MDDTSRLQSTLLTAIKDRLPELQHELESVNGHWVYEDLVYRFYHQSFKLYAAQSATLGMVRIFESLLPERPLNGWFRQIVAEGTGKTFTTEHNRRWLEVTRPMLEAFFHARYFLEMMCIYGAELQEPPSVLPSGWASVLYLYDLR